MNMLIKKKTVIHLYENSSVDEQVFILIMLTASCLRTLIISSKYSQLLIITPMHCSGVQCMDQDHQLHHTIIQ